MARECDGVERLMKYVCPLRCRLRNGAAAGQVDWAGLPTDLDLAFSREQRDKVYAQHVMRKQGSQLGRWLHDGLRPCACEAAAADGTVKPDAAKDYV